MVKDDTLITSQSQHPYAYPIWNDSWIPTSSLRGLKKCFLPVKMPDNNGAHRLTDSDAHKTKMEWKYRHTLGA